MRGPDVVGSQRVLTPSSGAPDVISAIVDTVRSSLGDAGGTMGDLVALGIGSPGSIEDGVVSHSPNVPGFQEEVALGALLSEALGGVRVRVGNDVRVAIRGEHVRGAGRRFTDFVGVWMGTGVGGGLVLGGALREGGGRAGEIGHIIVHDGGRRCGCGGLGHLEAYAGRRGMEDHAKHLVDKGKHTVLFDLMRERGRSRLTSGIFARAMEHGDHVAIGLIDDAVWAMGVALASTQNLLDVEAFVIGGGLGDRLGQPLIERITAAMHERLFVPERAPAVVGTELGDLGGAVGAAEFALSV